MSPSSKGTFGLKPLLFAICLQLPFAALAAEPESKLSEFIKKNSTTEQYCKYKTLEDMGWRINSENGASADALSIKAGSPCERTDLEQAHASGDLMLSLNVDPQLEDDKGNKERLAGFHQKLDELLLSQHSLCAYKYKVGKAAEEATAQLAQNVSSGNYSFGIGKKSFCEIKGNDWGPIKPLQAFFHPQTFNHCLKARTNPSDAIRCFYDKECQSECAVGLQVAELATQEALYGNKLNDAFSNDEMSVGSWGELSSTTENPFHSAKSWNESANDSDASEMSQIGLQYMVGVSGYIGNKLGESFLDSSNDRGENFMIVSVSPEAFKEIKDANGLEGVNKLNQELWEMHNKVVANESDANEMKDKITQILNDNPIYSGVKVYVHPLGHMTFGEHIGRLLEINPRTPYEIQLYRQAINGGLFKKFVQHKINDCEKANSWSLSSLLHF